MFRPILRRNRRRRPIGRRVLRLVLTALAGIRGVVRLGVVAAIVAAVPVGIYYGYHALIRSDYFAVTAIRIDGAVRLDRDEILEIIGLNEPRNIFTLNTDRMTEQLLANPWVVEAAIERELPRSVGVRIVERRSAGWLYWDELLRVDADGRVIVPDRPALVDSPVITGIDPGSGEGEGDFGAERIRTALGIMHLFETRGLSRIDVLSEIHFDELTGFTLLTGDRMIEIRLGYDRFSERLDRLTATLDALAVDELRGRYILLDGENDLTRVAVGPARPGRGARDPVD
jgi:cell division protein FtsQ